MLPPIIVLKKQHICATGLTHICRSLLFHYTIIFIFLQKRFFIKNRFAFLNKIAKSHYPISFNTIKAKKEDTACKANIFLFFIMCNYNDQYSSYLISVKSAHTPSPCTSVHPTPSIEPVNPLPWTCSSEIFLISKLSPTAISSPSSFNFR